MLEINKHVSVTDHEYGIGISSIFDTVFRYLPTFSYGITVLSNPQCPPQSRVASKGNQVFLKKNLIRDLKLNPLSKIILFSEKTKLDRNYHTHAGRQGLTWNVSQHLSLGFGRPGYLSW